MLARRHADAVDSVWLFGSAARGETGPLSDFDVAFLFSENRSPQERWELALTISGQLSQLGGPEIDVVILNEAPPLLKDRVLRYGRLLFCSNDERRIEFEARSLMEYLDFEPYLRRHDEAVIQRALEGRFAR